jgi:hypothetical protein
MRVRVLTVLGGIVLLTTACASSEQWAEWHRHSSHFASGDHLVFSFRHQGASPAPRVSKKDLERARAEGWWGEAIVVRPDQLFEG